MAIEYFHLHESDIDMINQLTELEDAVHGAHGFSKFDVYSYMRYGRVYAAVEYDELLGAAYFLRDFDNPGRAFLYGIIVAPEETGKGLGEALLMSAFGDLKESGLRMIEAVVHPSNAKALQVYTDTLGMNVISTPEEDGEEYVVLRRTL